MKNETHEIFKNFTILVVEDDVVARAMIKQSISKYFKIFYEASDGLEGFSIFKKSKIDIILTDIQMPNLTGLEMIRYIQDIKPKQPFIVITSYDSDENLLKSLNQGALNFLRKPIDIIGIKTALLLALSKNKCNKKQISQDVGIDFNSENIYLKNKLIFLSFTENKIFWLLCYNLNNLVSYDLIESYIYSNEYFCKKTIQVSISRIKSKLPDIKIKNISNQGYILKDS